MIFHTPDLTIAHKVTHETLSEAMQSSLKGWLCEDSGKIAGFAMGDSSTGEVQVVAITAEYENMGIGKKLLETVTDWLFSIGHEKVWLGANPDESLRAYGFYRKLGWIPVGKMKGNDEILCLFKR